MIGTRLLVLYIQFHIFSDSVVCYFCQVFVYFLLMSQFPLEMVSVDIFSVLFALLIYLYLSSFVYQSVCHLMVCLVFLTSWSTYSHLTPQPYLSVLHVHVHLQQGSNVNVRSIVAVGVSMAVVPTRLYSGTKRLSLTWRLYACTSISSFSTYSFFSTILSTSDTM